MRPEDLFREGAQAYRRDDFARTLDCCEELLAQNPDTSLLPAILNLKALALAGKGLLFDAIDCIEQAIVLKPDDGALHHHLSRILLVCGRMQKALLHAGKACQSQPDQLSYLYHLAQVYMLNDEPQKAQETAQLCVEKSSGFLEAWMLLSELATERGDTKVAVACLKEISRRDAGHERAWASLAMLPGDDKTDRQIETALENIRRKAKDADSAASATFALADKTRRRGDYQTAFSLYREANERLSADHPFDIDQWEEEVEKTLSRSRDWLQSVDPNELSATEDQGNKLAFIVGMPRSGTSLCEQIICSHTAVMGAGELTAMETIAKTLADREINPYDPTTEPGCLQPMREAYLQALPPACSAYSIVSDKTPRNFERLGMIFRLFPSARVLWCLRHPLDTILSCYFQDFGERQAFSQRLDHIARVYAGHVRLMQHWMHCPGHSIDVIEYSSLVQNLEAASREMADFLELDFQPAMLQPHLNKRVVRTASSEQVKKAVYTTSLNNWQHYRDELAELSGLLQQYGLIDENWRSTLEMGRLYDAN